MTRRNRMWLTLSLLGALALDLAALAVAVPYAQTWLEGGHRAAVVRAGAVAARGIERAGERGIAEVAAALWLGPAPHARNEYTVLLRARPLARTCAPSSECPYTRARTRLVRAFLLEATSADATGARDAECDGAPSGGCSSSAPAVSPGPADPPATTTGQTASGHSRMGLPVSGLITTMQ